MEFQKFCLAQGNKIMGNSIAICPYEIEKSNDQNKATLGDHDLVIQSCQGNQSAFALLVSRYQEKLYRMIYFMVHHQEESWDLLQDTFIKAYHGLPHLKNPEIFKSWITKIAFNLTLNHLKRQSRFHKHSDDVLLNIANHKDSSPQKALEEEESRELLRKAISLLPAKQKSVLVLCDMEGYSYKEAAEILKCRIGTIMSRLFYARNSIREYLKSVES